MSAETPILIIGAVLVVGLIATAIGVLVVAKMVNRLNSSFAKLGFVAREDAKKYFGDAAEKVVDMNSSFYQQYQSMIDEGVRKVLAESGNVMADSLAKAEQQAGSVILKAQENAQQILASTEQDAAAYYDRALSRSVDAMEWTLEQYMGEHLDITKHEEVIERLLEAYVNERRT